MDAIRFASELPYPKTEPEQSVSQSKLLMPCYAGAGGELNAVLTYCFQSFISPSAQELKRALEGVAKVEMIHMKLLGEAIYALGGYPVMGARTYYNGNMVNYTLDPHKFLRQNIAAEEATIVNYERTILNLSNESVKLLLERMILDEELHIKLFKELLENL